MGEAGERLAAGFLTDHGLTVVAHNVVVGRGEIDLLAFDGDARVAVEVRAISGDGDPIEAIHPGKRRQVTRLAGAVGATRVDFVGVRIGMEDVVVHWVPGCG